MTIQFPPWMQQQLAAAQAPQSPQTFGRWGQAPNTRPATSPGLLNQPMPTPSQNATTQTPGLLSQPPAGLPGMVANGSQWEPPANIPTTYNGTGGQAFSLRQYPTGANPTSLAELNYINSHPESLLAQRLAAMPQSITVSQWNAMAKANPNLAEGYLGKAGNDFRMAVQNANGWTNNQMNQWINAASYFDLGGNRYDTNANTALLRSLGMIS